MRLILALALLLTSNAVVLAQQAASIPVAAGSMIYDPLTRKIYASVGSKGQGAQVNSVTPIDPATGMVGASVYVGSDPRALVLSYGGKYLYVAVNDGHSVRRLETRTLAPGPTFPLGANLAVTALAPMPLQPESVIVMRHQPGVSPNDEGVAVYTNGIPRPNTVHAGHHLIVGLAPARLYGYESQISTWDFTLMDVHQDDGVYGVARTGSLLSGNVGFAGFANGLIVTDNGSVIDPEARQQVGKLPDTGFGTALCADGSTGKVFKIAGERGKYTLSAYDLRTFRLLGSVPILTEGGGYAGNLITCGPNALAFTAEDRIVLVHGDLGAKLPFVDLEVKRSAVPRIPPSGRFTYTLTVTNRSAQASTGVFLTDALPNGAEVETVKASQGNGLAADHVMRAELGPLAGGASATVDVTVRLTSAEGINFTAVVRGQEPDPAPENNFTGITTTKPAALLPDLAGSWGGVRQVSQGAGANLQALVTGAFTVRNEGKVTAGPSTLRFYLSASPIFSAISSQLLQEVPLPSLPGQRTVRVNLEAPLGVGDDVTGFFVFAVIDAGNDVQESDKKNNVVRAAIP